MKGKAKVVAHLRALAATAEADGRSARAPSIRDIAVHLGVSKTTVMTAVEDLCITGEMASRPRAGLFFRKALTKHSISETEADVSNHRYKPGSAWHRPELYATPSLTRAEATFRRRFDMATLHTWVPDAGQQRVRAILAEKLPPPGAPPIDVERLVLTGGVQESILLALVTIRSVSTSRIIYVEAPGWQGTTRLAEALGFEVCSIPRTERGYVWGNILDRCLKAPPAAFVVSPFAQNPLGTCLSASDRFELASLARQVGAYVVEDDCLRHTVASTSISAEPEMVLGSSSSVGIAPRGTTTLPSLCALLPEHTFYIDGFRKVLGPEFRIATLIAPSRLCERMNDLKMTFRLCAGGFLQDLLGILCEADAFERHRFELGVEVERANLIFANQMKEFEDVAFLAPRGEVIWPYRRVYLVDPAKADVCFAAAREGGAFIAEDDAFYSKDAARSGERWMRFNVTRALSGEAAATLELMRQAMKDQG